MTDSERWIQQRLNAGNLRPQHIELLTRAYQKLAKLTVDGMPGPKTLEAALCEVVGAEHTETIRPPAEKIPDLSLDPVSWLEGIDISHHQTVDWDQVPSEKDFAFFKATEGTTLSDPKMLEFLNRSHIPYVGIYHFARPSSAKLHGQGDPRLLPPVLDFEDDKPERGNGVELTDWAEEWVEHCERLIGRTPIFYSYHAYITVVMGGAIMKFDKGNDGKSCVDRLKRCPLWLADYRETPPHDTREPLSSWPWLFWQHSDKGKVPGITPRCDLNVFRGAIDQLDGLAK